MTLFLPDLDPMLLTHTLLNIMKPGGEEKLAEFINEIRLTRPTLTEAIVTSTHRNPQRLLSVVLILYALNTQISSVLGQAWTEIKDAAQDSMPADKYDEIFSGQVAQDFEDHFGLTDSDSPDA